MENTETTPQPENQIAHDYYRDELALTIYSATNKIAAALAFEKKRHGVHQNQLSLAFKSLNALTDAIAVMDKCLATDEDREDFAKRMLEHF